MKFVSHDQLLDSLRLLAVFREKAPKQAVKHILAFLALRWKDVETTRMTQFEEKDDFAFFDDFMKVDDGDHPYFDPIAGMMRAPGHPHSNVATARKGTFYRSWHAATSDVDGNGAERWKLEPDYLKIIKRKALTKGGLVVPVPAVPLGAYLFREAGFPDNASIEDVGKELRTRFHLTNEEYWELFEEETRPEGDFGKAPLTRPEVLAIIRESGVISEAREPRTEFQELTIANDDIVLRRVRQLLKDDGYAGVIFTGPPGTSKSWYAVQVAIALADGNRDRVRKIQFHRSYQYEQFVEGFVPNDDGTGFELRDQLMLRVIEAATDDPDGTFVVLIDELSRSDPGRVFGELLTYMEPTRRDETFLLASGREISIPPNIVFLATMNSRDKSVVEIDDAFDRRMGKIEFPPDPSILEKFLTDNHVPDDLKAKIVDFFKWVQPQYPIGHTFFRSVRDLEGVQRLWDTQLRFVFEKQFKYEPNSMKAITDRFGRITSPTAPAAGAPAGGPVPIAGPPGPAGGNEAPPAGPVVVG